MNRKSPEIPPALSNILREPLTIPLQLYASTLGLFEADRAKDIVRPTKAEDRSAEEERVSREKIRPYIGQMALVSNIAGRNLKKDTESIRVDMAVGIFATLESWGVITDSRTVCLRTLVPPRLFDQYKSTRPAEQIMQTAFELTHENPLFVYPDFQPLDRDNPYKSIRSAVEDFEQIHPGRNDLSILLVTAGNTELQNMTGASPWNMSRVNTVKLESVGDFPGEIAWGPTSKQLA